MLLSNTGAFGALSWILDSDQLRDPPEVVATTRYDIREDASRWSEATVAGVVASGIAAFRKLTAETDTCVLMISS